MLKPGPYKRIGTPVRCPSCRHRNLAIDIWCERCGTPLDWQRTREAASAPLDLAPEPDETSQAPLLQPPVRRARQPRVRTLPRMSLPAVALPKITLPRWHVPQWRMPRSTIESKLPGLRLPVIPRTVGIVAVVVAVLLFVPLAYLLLPGVHSVASRQSTPRLALTSANQPAPDSPQAAAIAAVQAKTGLKYASKCTGTAACLSITGQTMGQNAAAVVFSTAAKGGRECAAYVVQSSGKWRSLDTACGLPGQVTPLVGHDATVHVPDNCANVRDAANLQAGVVACLHDGATVKVDRGPVYADGLMWWHLSKGWMAHDFLVGP